MIENKTLLYMFCCAKKRVAEGVSGETHKTGSILWRWYLRHRFPVQVIRIIAGFYHRTNSGLRINNGVFQFCIQVFMGTLHCRDLGIDCSFVATGTTEQEIMRCFIDHAESAHRISVLSADVLYRVQQAIKK
jgi:predicted small metal-binding protein